MERIKIQSTRKQYLVVDQYDNELGVIAIDPSDTNIAKRAVTAKDNILAYIDEASQIVDEKNKENVIDELAAIDEKIKEEINTIFNYDVSAIVFGNIHCLSTSNGITFVENFLEAVTPIIEKEFEREFQAASNRISKYTERYHE